MLSIIAFWAERRLFLIVSGAGITGSQINLIGGKNESKYDQKNDDGLVKIL